MSKSSDELDDRCSEACTRAGIAILALAAAAFAIIPFAIKQQQYDVARRYVDGCNELRSHAEGITSSAQWKILSIDPSGVTVEELTTEEFLTQCKAIPKNVIQAKLYEMRRMSDAKRETNQGSRVPVPPSNLAVETAGVLRVLPAAPPKVEYLSTAELEETITRCYALIQAAQEREELTRKGYFSDRFRARVDRFARKIERTLKDRDTEQDGRGSSKYDGLGFPRIDGHGDGGDLRLF